MKRFTCTLKWSDPWFRRLSAPAKLIWFYAVDHCDAIGIVELDLEFVSSDCGVKCTDKHVAELGERIQAIGGNRYFIPKFIGFQYGKLSDSCRPHEKVIEAIRSHGLVLTPAGYRYPADRVCIGYQENLDGLPDSPQEQDRKSTGLEEDKKKRGTLPEIMAFCKAKGLYPRDAEYVWHRWEENGWKNGKAPIQDWRRTIQAWVAQGYMPSQKKLLDGDCWPVEADPSPHEEETDLMALLLANRAKTAAREAALAEPHDEEEFS